jgi:uncharacterized protein YcfL
MRILNLLILSLFLVTGCSSTYSEMRNAEIDRFQQQKSAWELYDMNTNKKVDVNTIGK